MGAAGVPSFSWGWGQDLKCKSGAFTVLISSTLKPILGNRLLITGSSDDSNSQRQVKQDYLGITIVCRSEGPQPCTDRTWYLLRPKGYGHHMYNGDHHNLVHMNQSPS